MKEIETLKYFSAKQILDKFCHPENFVGESINFTFGSATSTATNHFKNDIGNLIVTDIFATGQSQDGKIIEDAIIRENFSLEMADNRGTPIFNNGVNLFLLNRLTDSRRFYGLYFSYRDNIKMVITPNSSNLHVPILVYDDNNKPLSIDLQLFGYRITEERIADIGKVDPEVAEILQKIGF
jgi:hypothetical protein